MTGSIHHQNRPQCVVPEMPEGYPCHPAIVELTIDGETNDYCDFHATNLLEPDADIERIQIIDDYGGRRVWAEEDGTPQIWRAHEYAARAYVDYGCCLPGQIDPDRVHGEIH